jgi:hypothetical protein
MEPTSTHARYLFDLGRLLRAEAQEAHDRVEATPGAKSDFAAGEMMTWASVLSIMQPQAVAFDLPLSELGLDGLDPERDLL